MVLDGCTQHLMVPWFSTPKVRPSLGVLRSNSHAADAAAVQEGLALLNMSGTHFAAKQLNYGHLSKTAA